MEIDNLDLNETQEQETKTVELQVVFQLANKLGLDSELTTIMVGNSSKMDILQYMFKQQMNKILALEENLHGSVNEISFSKPSEFFTRLHEEDRHTLVTGWTEKFEVYEHVVKRICDSYRENGQNLRGNLEETYTNNKIRLTGDMFFKFNRTTQDERDILTAFYIAGNSDLETIEEHLKLKFIEEGLEKGNNPIHITYWEFVALFEPNYNPNSVIELVFNN